MKQIRSLWWIAVGLVVLSEAFILSTLTPKTETWADHDLLQLDIANLGAKLEALSNSPEIGNTPEESITFTFHERPEGLTGVVEQLSFSEGLCGIFATADQVRPNLPVLELFYFEYEPGNPRFIHDVFGHAPEVCMSASGAVLKAAHGTREIQVEGKPISVRVLEFSSPVSDSPLWIFKLTWVPADSPIKPTDTASSLRREKILAGITRSSRPPARVILAGGRNFDSLEDAWAAFGSEVVTNLYFSTLTEKR